jgi:hypothetical protein
MIKRLQELERKLAILPEAEQEQWVSHFLKELAMEPQVADLEATTERTWIGGRRPSPEEVAAAIEQLRQVREGKTLGDDATVQELINEGRRY